MEKKQFFKGEHFLFQRQIEEAQDLPPFPVGYQFYTLDFFDQYGVIIGMVNGEYVEQYERPADYNPWYLGLFIDQHKNPDDIMPWVKDGWSSFEA